MLAPAACTMRDLVLGPHAGQTLAVEVELAVHAEHELARHADLDAQPGVLLAQHAAGLEGGEEVGVAGRAGGVEVDAVGARLDHVVGDEVDVFDEHLGGLFLRLARLVDLAQRQQLGPVGDRVRQAWSSGPGRAWRRTAPGWCTAIWAIFIDWPSWATLVLIAL